MCGRITILGHNKCFMNKIPKVKVHRADNNHREIAWPYDHVPRIGEGFCFEVGIRHIVTGVSYNSLDGGGFIAVVTVDRDSSH